jgi:hypothetical protein
MTQYTVKIKCEFLEYIEANNEKEAEQLSLRMLNIGLSHCLTPLYASEVIVRRSQSQKEGERK